MGEKKFDHTFDNLKELTKNKMPATPRGRSRERDLQPTTPRFNRLIFQAKKLRTVQGDIDSPVIKRNGLVIKLNRGGRRSVIVDGELEAQQPMGKPTGRFSRVQPPAPLEGIRSRLHDEAKVSAIKRSPLLPQESQLTQEVEGVLDLRDWDLGDDVLKKLTEEQWNSIELMNVIILRGNRFTDETMVPMISALGSNIEKFDISHNNLSILTIKAFVQKLATLGSFGRLQMVDLSRNRLDEVLLENLILNLPLAAHLKRLALADTGIGRRDKTGMALGAFLKSSSLEMLDLNFNNFRGLGASELFEGIYEHGYAGKGSLMQLDISWNALSTRPFCTRICKCLGSIFRENDNLFHLDISFNRLIASDMEHIAEGLQYNTTLMGLHVTGNEAMIDPFGYLLPLNPLNIPNSILLEADEERLAMKMRVADAEARKVLLEEKKRKEEESTR